MPWKAFTSENGAPEIAAKRRKLERRTPNATVTVRLFGVEHGNAEIELQASPDGAFGKIHSSSAVERTEGHRLLLEAATRELSAGSYIISNP